MLSLFSVSERVKCVFDYHGTPPPDNGRQIIQLQKDDVLEVIDRSDPSWLKVRPPGSMAVFFWSFLKSMKQFLFSRSI